MKKFLIAMVFTAGSVYYGNAQVDKTDNPTEDAHEQLQQEPPRQAQASVEKNAVQSATQDKRNDEQAQKDRKKAAAQKATKEKARSQAKQ